MKTCFLIFNFPRDYALAEALHSPLRRDYALAGEDVDYIWCVESKHAGVPVPDGVKLLVRDFNRGGSLKYTEALHAMAKIYAEIGNKYDCIVKLDADTKLMSPLVFTDYIARGGDLAYIPHVDQRGTGNGCCYAMSGRAARSLVRISPADFDHRAHHVDGREDMFFTGAIAANPAHYVAMVPRNRISFCGSREQPKRPIAVHLGYLSEEDIVKRLALFGQFVDKPSDSAYAQDVAAYCAANSIEIPKQEIRFTLSGERLPDAK